MSALVVDPAPRPQPVGSPRRRGHLRLVTADFVPEAPRARAVRPAGVAGRPRATQPRLLAPAAPATSAAGQVAGARLSSRRPAAPRPCGGAAADVVGRVAAGQAGQAGRVAAVAQPRPRATQPRPLALASTASTCTGTSLEARLGASLRGLVRAGVMVVVLVLSVASAVVVGTALRAPLPATTTAVVQSGQSLWDVAVATGAEDVPEAVEQIYQLNGLHSSALQPGQVLLVPAS